MSKGLQSNPSSQKRGNMESNKNELSLLEYGNGGTEGAITTIKKTQQHSASKVAATKNNYQREAAISKMFAYIFLLFLFGYMPYGIIRMFDKSNSLHPDVYVLLTVWFVITSNISPFIVMQMNSQIREQFRIFFNPIFNR